jgi:hypothetical protein
MRVFSRLLIPFVSAVACLLVLSVLSVDAQNDKKKKKKAEEKKVEEKKEEKKTEVKEEKKEPFVPDTPKVELKGHGHWVTVVQFTTDGNKVVSASRDRTVKVWDLASKKDTSTLKGNTSDVKGLVLLKEQIISSDGKFNKEKKAWEGEIKFWDGKSEKAGKSLKGHEKEIESLTLSADGKYLLSASEDGTVKIWDVASGKDMQTLKGHADAVWSAAMSADGKHVATGSRDGSVKIWDASNGKELGAYKVEKVEKKTDDKTKKEIVTKVSGRDFTQVVFTLDGKRVIAANLDGEIKILSVPDAKLEKEWKAPDGIWALAITKDGKRIATGGWDQTIKIWDLAQGKDVQTIKAHHNPVISLSFSEDGKRIVSGGADNLIKVWDVK